MSFLDTVIMEVFAGAQAESLGVEPGWCIAEVGGKAVLRGFAGSDRAIFHRISESKNKPITLVFEAPPSEKGFDPSPQIAANGAATVTLVLEAKDVGLTIVTKAGASFSCRILTARIIIYLFLISRRCGRFRGA